MFGYSSVNLFKEDKLFGNLDEEDMVGGFFLEGYEEEKEDEEEV